MGDGGNETKCIFSKYLPKYLLYFIVSNKSNKTIFDSQIFKAKLSNARVISLENTMSI